MPSLNIRKVGDGPRCYAVWLDTWPVFLDGLDGLPHIGDRFQIDGELWRVVEGLPRNREFLAALAKELKRTCGTGGTTVDDRIELQGDHRDKLREALRAKRWTVKG